MMTIAQTKTLVFIAAISNACVSGAVAGDPELKSTSWSLTHLLAEGDDPTPIASNERNLVSVLGFQDDSLVATFFPCTGRMQMTYGHEADAEVSAVRNAEFRPLEITDTSAECPECTTPQEQARTCNHDDEAASSSSALATAFVDALFDTSSYQVTDDGKNLLLFDQEGTVLMEATSCRTESKLAGTSWQPTTIWTKGDESPIHPLEVIDHRSISAHFENCEMRGQSGCNGYSGEYKTLPDTDEIVVNGVSATLMACMDPQVSRVENAYLSAVEKVAAYSIDDETNTLNLMDADGTKLVSFAKCEQVSLTETQWMSKAAIRGTMWNIGEKQVTAKFEQVFGQDGILRGSTLCGDYEVNYTLDPASGSIKFLVEDWPEVQCDRANFQADYQYENAIKFETEFPEALRAAQSYSIEMCSDHLAIYDEEGRSLLGFAVDEAKGETGADGTAGNPVDVTPGQGQPSLEDDDAAAGTAGTTGGDSMQEIDENSLVSSARAWSIGTAIIALQAGMVLFN